MTLDEIMEEEKFNDVDKALVNDPMLSQVERIKIICEIRTMKINEIQSDNMTMLTLLLALLGGLSFVYDDSSVLDSRSSKAIIFGLVFIIWAIVMYTSLSWPEFRKKLTGFVRRFWRSRWRS